MKIGILTFHYAINQGAVLQAYALQEAIRKLGHDVEFVDYRPRYPVKLRDFIAKSPVTAYEKTLNTIIGFWWQEVLDCFGKINKRGSVRYRSDRELFANPPLYDAYVVGSDQVWNFTNSLNPAYLMEWVPSDRRVISYAASMGQCVIPEAFHDHIRHDLSRFAAISLREKKARDFVASLLPDKEIVQTVDPTLLLSSNDFQRIIEPVSVDDEYVATYILSILEPAHRDILDKVKNVTGLRIVNLRNPSTCVFLYGRNEKNKIVTPYQWLDYIQKSKYVVCSSFHAVVFSLIFHKPFLVIMPLSSRNNGGNVRILSLLEPLGLSSHCIYESEGNNVEKILNDDIDWETVERKLLELRNSSLDFLRMAL